MLVFSLLVLYLWDYCSRLFLLCKYDTLPKIHFKKPLFLISNIQIKQKNSPFSPQWQKQT